MAKILLVEDNEMNRDMLSRRLEKKGYDIVFAVDGEEAVQNARSENPDLILMDLSLPILDGWEATRRIKADEGMKKIPVIALTALDSPFDEIMWLARTDLQDFIVKSRLPRRELIARIERALQTHDRSPPQSAEQTAP